MKRLAVLLLLSGVGVVVGCRTEEAARQASPPPEVAAVVDGAVVTLRDVSRAAHRAAAGQLPTVRDRAAALGRIVDDVVLARAEHPSADARPIDPRRLEALFARAADASGYPSAGDEDHGEERLVYVASFDRDEVEEARAFAKKARARPVALRPPESFGVPVRPRVLPRGGPVYVEEPLFSARAGTIVGPLLVEDQLRVWRAVEPPSVAPERSALPVAIVVAVRAYQGRVERAGRLLAGWGAARIEIVDDELARFFAATDIPGGPGADGVREVVRLARACGYLDPRQCQAFAALETDRRRQVREGGLPPSAWPDVEMGTALSEGCLRTADETLCASHLEIGSPAPDLSVGLGLCLAGGDDVSDPSARARAQGCWWVLRALQHRDDGVTVDERGVAWLLARTCAFGGGEGCRAAAEAALRRGDLAAAKAYLEAARGAGALSGPEEAYLVEEEAKDRACQAGTLTACLDLADATWRLVEQPAFLTSPVAATTSRLRRVLGRACELGSTEACAASGRLLLEGRGLPVDLDLARFHLRAACNGDDAAALAPSWCAPLPALEVATSRCAAPSGDGCVLRARFFAAPTALAADRTRGLDLLEASCRAGQGRACDAFIGLLYDEVEPPPAIPSDLARVRRLCAAVRDEGKASVACGVFDELTALTSSCDGGDPRGCHAAVELVARTADPSAPDRDEGRRLLRRACSLGARDACTELVTGDRGFVDVGHGLAQLCERPSAVRLEACVAFGRHLREARGGRREPERALQVLEATCEAGEPEACARTGAMLLTGEAGRYDVDAGRALLREACDDGSHYACRFPVAP